MAKKGLRIVNRVPRKGDIVLTVGMSRQGRPVFHVGGSRDDDNIVSAILMLSAKGNRKKIINKVSNPTKNRQAMVIGIEGDYYKKFEGPVKDIRDNLKNDWYKIISITTQDDKCKVVLSKTTDDVVYSEEFYKGCISRNNRLSHFFGSRVPKRL